MTKSKFEVLNAQLTAAIAIKKKRIQILELQREKMILEQAAIKVAAEAAKAQAVLATIK